VKCIKHVQRLALGFKLITHFQFVFIFLFEVSLGGHWLCTLGPPGEVVSHLRDFSGPTRPSVLWVQRVKRPGREADHSPPYSAEGENEWWLYFHSPNTSS